MEQSFTLGTMGILDGLHAHKPSSSNKPKVYFLCFIEMLEDDLAISKPRKYLRSPRSRSLKKIFISVTSCYVSLSLLDAIMMSST